MTAETEINNINKKREEIFGSLSKFGINRDDVLFLNEKDPAEPWLSSDQLMSIARQAGGYKTTSITFDKFIPERQQVIYTALVEDEFGRTYVRSGAATENENAQIDADTLAQARSMKAALTASGFNPFKAGSVVSISDKQAQRGLSQNELAQHETTEEAALRVKDLKQIHALAVAKRLINFQQGFKDDSAYRVWLFEKFNIDSAAQANRVLRAQIINALNLYDQLERPNLTEEELRLLA